MARLRPPRLARALRIGRPFRPSELALAFLALGIFAALAFGPRIVHGGFHLDDWSNAANALRLPNGPGLGSAMSQFAEFTIYRPVLVVYVPLSYFIFGMNMHYHLAWAVALGVLAVTMLYGSLRLLGVPWIHALAIAALMLIFPWSDSTRLWVTADQVTLSLVFAGAGLFVALVGLKRLDWRFHLAAATLYALSILAYEITLPLILCTGFLYWFRAGWREARWRWLVDVVVAAAAAGWNGSHTARTAAGIGADLTHLKQIVDQGAVVLARAGLPLGHAHTGLVLIVLALVLGVGVCAYFLFPDRFAGGRWGLRQWLLMAFGGLAVLVLGWTMFIPADPYYTPSIFGEVNRVNGLAAYGMVLLFYGAFGVVASLVGEAYRRAVWVAPAALAILAVALLGAYLHVLRRHIEIWNLAYAAERTAIVTTREAFPRLPPGTRLFATSYPANQAPGVPIFAATWDYAGMLLMEYDDSSLWGYPVVAELRVRCRARGVVLVRGGTVEGVASYGKTRFLNLATGAHTAPRDRAACRRAVPRYPPGPLFLSPTY